jgi:hypothetical protein
MYIRNENDILLCFNDIESCQNIKVSEDINCTDKKMFDKEIFCSNVYCNKCNIKIGLQTKTASQNKSFFLDSILFPLSNIIIIKEEDTKKEIFPITDLILSTIDTIKPTTNQIKIQKNIFKEKFITIQELDVNDSDIVKINELKAYIDNLIQLKNEIKNYLI